MVRDGARWCEMVRESDEDVSEVVRQMQLSARRSRAHQHVCTRQQQQRARTPARSRPHLNHPHGRTRARSDCLQCVARAAGCMQSHPRAHPFGRREARMCAHVRARESTRLRVRLPLMCECMRGRACASNACVRVCEYMRARPHPRVRSCVQAATECVNISASMIRP
eukprot:6209516-Pleurochrysis_carterae.AAC.2